MGALTYQVETGYLAGTVYLDQLERRDKKEMLESRLLMDHQKGVHQELPGYLDLMAYQDLQEQTVDMEIKNYIFLENAMHCNKIQCIAVQRYLIRCNAIQQYAKHSKAVQTIEK